MSFPQYPAFLQLVRENDPTRVTEFVANILETLPKPSEKSNATVVIRKPRQKPLVQVLSIRILRRPKPPPLQSNSSTAKGLSSAFAPSKARSIISRGAMPSLSLASRQ